MYLNHLSELIFDCVFFQHSFGIDRVLFTCLVLCFTFYTLNIMINSLGMKGLRRYIYTNNVQQHQYMKTCDDLILHTCSLCPCLFMYIVGQWDMVHLLSLRRGGICMPCKVVSSYEAQSFCYPTHCEGDYRLIKSSLFLIYALIEYK